MNLKLILADQTEVSLLEFTLPMHAVVSCDTEDEVLAIWKCLTPENLASVEVQENGESILSYRYGGLEGVQSIMNGDGTVTAHFFLQGERVQTNEADAEYVQAAKILLGEES